MQRTAGPHRWFARSATIFIVVGLHAFVLILVWKSRDLLTERQAPADRFLLWVAIDRPLPSPHRPESTQPEIPEASSPTRVQESTAPPPAATRTEPLPPSQIDWNAHGTYAARKAVEESFSEPYRNFGPRKPGPPSEPVPPPLFEEEEDVLGEEAKDIHGDPVVRLSKYCYQELEKTVQTARDWVEPRPRLRMCMFPAGSPEPRGDLFEHLKKDRPLPAPKEGVPQELPERKEP